jgi:hypothetical protein
MPTPSISTERLHRVRSPREKVLALILLAVAAGFAIFVVTRKVDPPTNTRANDARGAAGPADRRRRRELPVIGGDGVTAPGPVAESVAPTHAAGPRCESCSAQNCTAATDGCDGIVDSGDRALCEDLYDCFADAAHDCTIQGDPVRCWCGTHPTTCLTHATGPLSANGPCLDRLIAAAKTADPKLIRDRFVDANFPLGRAVNLTSCRGSFCTGECQIK